MRGSLESSSVVDLCRGLAEAAATGTLSLEGPAETGRIVFRDGRVRAAESPAPRARLGDRLVNAALLTQDQLDVALEQQADADERTKLGALLVDQELVSRDAIRVFVQEQILDAVFELVGWREGTYEFTRSGDETDEKLPVDIPVDQLLVEVSRRQSEWDQIARVLPDLDMVPDFTTGGSSADAALEPDEFAMLASVDGQRSVRDLASHLGYSEFEAARIVYGLTLIGVIGIFEPDTREEPAAPAPDQPVEEPTEAPDTLDVGAALEDALQGEDADEPADVGKPSVRVHIADDGTFPRRSGDEPGSVEEVAEEEEPLDHTFGDGAEATGPPGDDLEVELGAEFEARSLEESELDTPEIGEKLEEEDASTSEVVEPEPWTPEQAGITTPKEPSHGPTAEQDEEGDETAAPSRDLDDDEFEKLINQLAGAPPSSPEPKATPSPSEDRQDEDVAVTGDPATSDPAAGTPRPEDDTAPTAGPSEEGNRREERTGREERGGGDVSEFLRELSRLAVDDDDGGGSEPVAPPKESRPSPRGKDQDQRENEDEKKDQETEDKKKRGFFGWGR